MTDTLQGALAQEKTLRKLQEQIPDYFLSLTKHKKNLKKLIQDESFCYMITQWCNLLIHSHFKYGVVIEYAE